MKKVIGLLGIALLPGCITIKHHDQDMIREFQLQQCSAQLQQAQQVFDQIKQQSLKNQSEQKGK